MRFVLKVLGVALFLAAGGSPVVAQTDAIELTRAVIQTERQAIVAANMQLTEAEGKKFWPMYREYRGELAKQGDRMVNLITKYADEYENLSEETSSWMVEEFLSLKKAELETRSSWIPRFREVLTAKQVARFIQIENKMDAIVLYDLAASIPLIK